MHTKCVVLWGHAPSKSNPIGLYPMILQAQKNGAYLIVVDPRRIPEAEKADMWLAIRPVTVVALMLGWLRIIVEEKLYDADFVANWTIGFEDLKTAIAEYTPQKLAEITWLSPEQVVSSARCYATTKPAMITWGFGLDKQGVNATQAARARCCLRAISGNLDIQGGEPLGLNETVGRNMGDEAIEFNSALPAEQRAKQLGENNILSLVFRVSPETWRPTAACPQNICIHPMRDSKLAKFYPLVLVSGSRFMPMYHSEQRQIQAARKKRPDPLVTLHPDVALSREERGRTR